MDTLDLFLRDCGAHTLLTYDEEKELCRRVQAGQRAEARLEAGEGNEADRAVWEQVAERGMEARDTFILHNIQLVVKEAIKFQPRMLEPSEYINEGISVGLIRAIEKYDGRNRFSTYATWWIRNAFQRANAGQGTTIRHPVYVHETDARLRKHFTRLWQLLEREPTLQELGMAVGMSVKRVTDHYHFTQAVSSLDYDRVGGSRSRLFEGERPRAEMIADEHAPDPDEAVMQSDLRTILERAIGGLSAREERILRLRFGWDAGDAMTLEEIAARFGVTRERIRQLETSALRKLRGMPEVRGLATWIYPDTHLPPVFAETDEELIEEPEMLEGIEAA